MFHGGLPSEDAYDVEAAMLAERTGWTLDYIDGLDNERLQRVKAIYEALDKAKHQLRQQGGD